MVEEEHPAHSKIREDIATHGWSLMGVLPSDEHPSGWAYSIGATTTFRHSEVAVFALGDEALALLNLVLASLQARPLETGVDYTEFFEDGRPCRFLRVDDQWLPYYFGRAFDFYMPQTIGVIQLVWSDGQNKFPWEESCDPEVRDLQPNLGVISTLEDD